MQITWFLVVANSTTLSSTLFVLQASPFCLMPLSNKLCGIAWGKDTNLFRNTSRNVAT